MKQARIGSAANDVEVLKMLCRWLAVLVLAGFLLVIEAIAVSQGTLSLSPREILLPLVTNGLSRPA